MARNTGARMTDKRYDGFVPGSHVIEGYGAGGFQFAGMSHRGSILALPSGVHAWQVSMPTEIPPASLQALLDEPRGSVELLIIGTGLDLVPASQALRDLLREAGIRSDAMATGAAISTYNILLGERRRVAAALLAVP
jgi:uncharacterized protein